MAELMRLPAVEAMSLGMADANASSDDKERGFHGEV